VIHRAWAAVGGLDATSTFTCTEPWPGSAMRYVYAAPGSTGSGPTPGWTDVTCAPRSTSIVSEWPTGPSVRGASWLDGATPQAARRSNPASGAVASSRRPDGPRNDDFVGA
jgi:hypothetical protein